MRRAFAVSLALCAVAAPAAHARSDMTVDGGEGGVSVTTDPFTDDENHTLRLSLAGSTLTVHDATSTLRATSGCVQRDPRTVDCTYAPGVARDVSVISGSNDDVVDASGLTGDVRDLRIDAGFGDDRVISAPLRGTAGEGEDFRRIEAGGGRDVVIGSDFDDSINGDAGPDEIRAGRGDDYLSGDYETGGSEVDDDVLDGGTGSDYVEYPSRDANLVVDLAAGTGGQEGERDQLIDIEGAGGGKRRNVLLGDDADNFLNFASKGSRCGAGKDVIRPKSLRVFPHVPEDCERIAFGRGLASGRPKLRRSSGMVVLSFEAPGRLVRGRLTVDLGGKVIARARVRPSARLDAFTVRAKLTAAGRRAKLRGKTVRVVLRSSGYPTQGFRARIEARP